VALVGIVLLILGIGGLRELMAIGTVPPEMLFPLSLWERAG
jgi:hypothetical protein